MNKYEKLFQEIYEMTKGGDLKWKLISRNAHSDIIFNPSLVFRQFESRMVRDGDEYKVLFVEKKSAEPDYDYLEKYWPEVVVLCDGELIASLGDSVIERQNLISLMELIESKSDKAKKLFKE
ncbi:MAG TPA: hypothetical protein VIG33_18270 [Pseudobdellovibrionaceae bacterium]